MIERIDKYMFRDRFRDYGRQNDFSADALEVLFEYLEQLEEDFCKPVELDVVGLCCDYTESTLEELSAEAVTYYGREEPFADLDEAEDWLRDHTTICGQTATSLVYEVF